MSKYLTDADMAEIDRLHVKADLLINDMLRSIDMVKGFIELHPRALPYIDESYATSLSMAAQEIRAITNDTVMSRRSA